MKGLLPNAIVVEYVVLQILLKGAIATPVEGCEDNLLPRCGNNSFLASSHTSNSMIVILVCKISALHSINLVP